MNAFIDSANFSTATTVYLDSLLTLVAPDGYYSSQGYYRQQVDGKLIDVIQCAEIDTLTVSSIGDTFAIFIGKLISNGGDTSAVRGFVYGTSPDPTTANSVLTDPVRKTGVYFLPVTGLTTGVTYYVRAYAIIFGNTIYGDELSFTTLCSNCVPGTEITIGTQIWTGCNLNVSTYRDGTIIPQVTDPTAWVGLTTGAWCYYDNDPANDVAYGKMYNWFAVAGIDGSGTPRNLAPVGYHVPSDEEFTTLTTYLGGTDIAGGNMKETGLCHWQSPNEGATNSSSFRGISGGFRQPGDGNTTSLGYNLMLWSSTEVFTNNAYNLNLRWDSDNAFRRDDDKNYGFSVRLIKD